MDEDALVEALDSGRVRSVGLDVYQREPDIHPGLLANPHVCLLPHMGTSTVEVGLSFRIQTILTESDKNKNGGMDHRQRSVGAGN